MPGNRKLGRNSSQRKALLRNQVTQLLYHGKIVTTETRAKEVKKIAEKLITIAIREKDQFETVEKTIKRPRKDAEGRRIKEKNNGKTVTVYDEVQQTIEKDLPSRLNARRKIRSVVYPVTEKANLSNKRKDAKTVNLAQKLFKEIAPKYEDRKGGYTRIVKLAPRKGDGALEVVLELV